MSEERTRVFITGITGTLGQMVTKILMHRGCSVVGYSRDEQKQRVLRQELVNYPVEFENNPMDVTLYLGDVRDAERLEEATRGVDILFHFAALKCVDTLEENPEEAVATNVYGTQNVLHAQRVNYIPRVVLASTDKAVYPINAYGASKKLAESLVLRNPNNVVCRYGNVLGSRGSVLPMFVAALKSGKDPIVGITDKRMTRFWTTVERAANFVINTGIAKPGGLYTPQIEAAPVVRVLDAVAENLGVQAYAFREIGIRAGEKLHECLLTDTENAAAGGAGDVMSSDLEMGEEALRQLIAEAIRCL